MTQPSQETEICIAGPFTLALLRAAPWLKDQTPKRQQLRSVYWDTPEATLARASTGLRLRREAGRWVQTLKIEQGPDSRAEFNHVIGQRTVAPLPAIDPAGLPSSTALHSLGIKKSTQRALEETDRLLPQFEVRVTRQIWTISYGESELEIAYDHGEIFATEANAASGLAAQENPHRHCPINELELELVSGNAAALWSLAREFLLWLSGGFAIEPRSKALRGYRLVWPTAGRMIKTAACSARGFGPVLTHHLRAASHMLAHRLVQIPSRSDPEDIHQARVALRQIRTLLKLLIAAGYPEPAQTLLPQCASLATQLGPVRDIDVVLETILQPLRTRLPADTALKNLTAAAQRYQADLRATVTSLLAGPLPPVLLCDLGQLCYAIPAEPLVASPSAADFAKVEAERLKKRVDRREKRCRQQPGAESDHRLRLAHKALRYASPLLRDLGAPQNLTRWAKESARAQEKLGAAQDRATALQTLSAALHHSPISEAEQTRGLALVEGWLLTIDGGE